MGEAVGTTTFTREQRRRYREKLIKNLDRFDAYLASAGFDDEATIGLEIEINLVDSSGRPVLKNREVLEEIADEAFQTEIGAYNIELNVPALSIRGQGLAELEESLRVRMNAAEAAARTIGAGLCTIGILPTVGRDLIDSDLWMTGEKRYEALNRAILEARGEDVRLEISGIESLDFYASNVAPEATCTSIQLHLQVAPRDFAASWNAAQIIAGPQAALAANSPFFLGSALWHESRIVVFKQAIDSRPPEMRNQGVRPRVWFGERWITSVFDLFEENVRFFPALLPELTEVPEFTDAGCPVLPEMRMHNGTVYRWNRPIYDPGTNGTSGQAHLRVENRLLPAGPTMIDTVANAAFFYGLVEMLRDAERPLWSRIAFATARENFGACARDGLGATVYWPQVGEVPVDELLNRRLIPLAAAGLRRLEVDDALIAKYIDVLSGRALSGQNGARWQLDTVAAFEAGGLSRTAALERMTVLYSENMHRNEPVHTWSVPG